MCIVINTYLHTYVATLWHGSHNICIYHIAGFCCKDFNVALNSIHNIKIIIALIFLYCCNCNLFVTGVVSVSHDILVYQIMWILLMTSNCSCYLSPSLNKHAAELGDRWPMVTTESFFTTIWHICLHHFKPLACKAIVSHSCCPHLPYMW